MHKHTLNSRTPWNLINNTSFLKKKSDISINSTRPPDPIQEEPPPTTPTLEEQLCAYYIKNYKPSSASPAQHILPPSTPATDAHEAEYTALADTAATHHYVQTEALPYCTNVQSASGPTVTVANGGTIRPQAQATLPISSHLLTSVKQALVFDDLKTGSLISL